MPCKCRRLDAFKLPPEREKGDGTRRKEPISKANDRCAPSKLFSKRWNRPAGLKTPKACRWEMASPGAPLDWADSFEALRERRPTPKDSTRLGRFGKANECAEPSELLPKRWNRPARIKRQRHVVGKRLRPAYRWIGPIYSKRRRNMDIPRRFYASVRRPKPFFLTEQGKPRFCAPRGDNGRPPTLCSPMGFVRWESALRIC